jgi:hypothetical protein
MEALVSTLRDYATACPFKEGTGQFFFKIIFNSVLYFQSNAVQSAPITYLAISEVPATPAGLKYNLNTKYISILQKFKGG